MLMEFRPCAAASVHTTARVASSQRCWLARCDSHPHSSETMQCTALRPSHGLRMRSGPCIACLTALKFWVFRRCF